MLTPFGINGKVVGTREGAVVKTYEFLAQRGTKYSKIQALEEDLALYLGVKSVRISREYEKILIEVPKDRQIVDFMKLASSQHFTSKKGLWFVVGEDIGGNPIIKDLAKMPHLLIAGATGAGKSVALNCLILSLMQKNCKFLMIDPKRVELGIYKNCPQLVQPVITDPDDALMALESMIVEMEDRYDLLASQGLRTLTSLPPIVVIIDEFADLMMTAKVEQPIVRLAQKARAVGIHLVLATQRPSVKVVTGSIKANFPARMALRTSSQIDSRVIIDQKGAEKLLGKGDMLFVDDDGLNRYHGAFISDEDTKMLIEQMKLMGR